MLKTALAAGFAAAVVIASSPSYAITVTNNGNNYDPGVATTNPTAISTSGTVLYNLSGSVSGQWRSPFESTPHPSLLYTSVQGGSSGLWTFGGFMDSLSLIWGSPDNYNTIEFFSDLAGTLSLGSVSNGSIIPPGPNAIQNALVTITAIGFFQSVRISSGQNAFEFSNLTASCDNCAPGETPIPGALPLFAGGLGVIGLLTRRYRRKQAA